MPLCADITKIEMQQEAEIDNFVEFWVTVKNTYSSSVTIMLDATMFFNGQYQHDTQINWFNDEDRKTIAAGSTYRFHGWFCMPNAMQADLVVFSYYYNEYGAYTIDDEMTKIIYYKQPLVNPVFTFSLLDWEVEKWLYPNDTDFNFRMNVRIDPAPLGSFFVDLRLDKIGQRSKVTAFEAYNNQNFIANVVLKNLNDIQLTYGIYNLQAQIAVTINDQYFYQNFMNTGYTINLREPGVGDPIDGGGGTPDPSTPRVSNSDIVNVKLVF